MRVCFRSPLVPIVFYCFIVAGCATTIPLPKHLEPKSTGDISNRMRNAISGVGALMAEARLTYFGPQGRIRATAELAMKRPSAFRFDVLGPHGAVIEAFSTDGAEIYLISNKEGSFQRAPANVRYFDRLQALLPLGLDATGWLGLLLGYFPAPTDATHSYSPDSGLFILTFEKGGATVRLHVDPYTAFTEIIELYREGKGSGVIEINDRDRLGVPTRLGIQLGEQDVSLQIHIRDLEHYPSGIAQSVFRLKLPEGAKWEYLD